MLLSRRVLCVVSSFLIITAAPPAFAKPKDKHSLPPRATATVDHIVVVMMENRSFDHLLGWHPTANGRQLGLSYPPRTADPRDLPARRAPRARLPRLRAPRSGSFLGGRADRYNDGAMDGFLLAGMNDDYAIGFYGKHDRPSTTRSRANTPPSTISSRRSWARRIPTASSCTRRKPIASRIPSSSRPCRRSGIG